MLLGRKLPLQLVSVEVSDSDAPMVSTAAAANQVSLVYLPAHPELMERKQVVGNRCVTVVSFASVKGAPE